MAPGRTELPVHDQHQQSADDATATTAATKNKQSSSSSYPREPLQLRGVLDKFAYEEATPLLGREYPGVNIVDDLLRAPDSDALLRDVAITISQRGVVFFRAQDNLTDELQKELVHRLGLLAGKPETSSLHIHPLLHGTSEFGVGDNEISTISSTAFRKVFQHQQHPTKRHIPVSWHSDIQFEACPADYTSLRLTQLPADGGGDTLWASGYEIYDRFSRPYQKFFEGLTATFIGDGFIRAAERDPEHNVLYDQPRGSPLNAGRHLTAVHPVVRTNPVTGWKSIFALGAFPKKINELEAGESKELLDRFYRVILDNPDATVRFKWKNPNDIAIWDNRSFFHTATFDYQGDRFGHRTVGIAEKPYLDPNSKSRTEELVEQGLL